MVTGGSEGIGFGCTYTLLKHNAAKVYILSPSEEVVKGAKAAIGKDLGQEAANKTIWLQCDLSDWKRTKEVAEQIKSENDRLDILINNAARGIMTYQLTDYGVDRHMAVNHMGHVVFTSHLLPLIKKTAASGKVVRIANQSSNAHQGTPSDTKFESLEELNQDLGPNGLYGRSKLAGVSLGLPRQSVPRTYPLTGPHARCHMQLAFTSYKYTYSWLTSESQILYARYLDRHITQNGYPNILINASHPGFVSTKQSKVDIHEPYPLGGYAMSVLMEPFKKDQFEGCVPMMFIATTTEESGQYVCAPCVPEAGSELSQDDALGESLMKLTRKVVMEKTKRESKDQGCPFDDVVLH